MSVGLYIHVPFCRTRCHFCAFYLQIHREDRALAYLDSLAQEIKLHAEADTLAGRPLRTVYFGGGTPTTLTPSQLSRVLQLVRRTFGLHEQAEITLEAHPDTVTSDGLHSLAEAGFNRISFGVQSMDHTELVRIGRRTQRESIETAVNLARMAGFENINLDLIYGLPGQTAECWRSTLEETLSLDPTHLSCYALSIEDRTKLWIDVHREVGKEPDPELQNVMEAEAEVRLIAAGFQHYEISNYCRAGYACRHNLLYWQGHDYLGLGPSAQSYIGGCRFGNVEDLSAYHRRLAAGQLPTNESLQLTPKQRLRETIVLGLRLLEGVDLGVLRAFNEQTDEQDTDWHRSCERLIRRGLLEVRSGRIKLTEVGRRFADSVAVELL